MFFTNLIISSLLNFQSIDIPEESSQEFKDDLTTNNFISGIFSHRKEEVLSEKENIRLVTYLQSVDLVYQDIYEYTKPYLYKPINKDYTAGELNPVANFFFKNNLWDLAFVSANAFNYLIFNTDFLYPVYSIVLNAAEIWAISTWSAAATNGINVEATLFIHTF